MLTNQTIDKLTLMRMPGMAAGLADQLESTEIGSLSFEERLGLLVDREFTHRANRRLARLLKEAKLRVNACIEDIDYRAERSLDKSLIRSLADCAWVGRRHNVIITGATGAGKTYLACALGNSAARADFSVRYWRTPRLLEELRVARADGSWVRLVGQMTKVNLLILDDWGLVAPDAADRRSLLEIFEERSGRGSTLVASQVPVENWHETIGNPTLADAILDRVVHNAHKIVLKGGSMRKVCSDLTPCRPL